MGMELHQQKRNKRSADTLSTCFCPPKTTIKIFSRHVPDIVVTCLDPHEKCSHHRSQAGATKGTGMPPAHQGSQLMVLVGVSEGGKSVTLAIGSEPAGVDFDFEDAEDRSSYYMTAAAAAVAAVEADVAVAAVVGVDVVVAAVYCFGN